MEQDPELGEQGRQLLCHQPPVAVRPPSGCWGLTGMTGAPEGHGVPGGDGKVQGTEQSWEEGFSPVCVLSRFSIV